jgi:hypothetical protein
MSMVPLIGPQRESAEGGTRRQHACYPTRRFNGLPELLNLDPQSARSGMARGFSHDLFVIEDNRSSRPHTQSLANAQPQRIRRIALGDIIDVCLATDVVVSVPRGPQPPNDIAARMHLRKVQRILGEVRRSG